MADPEFYKREARNFLKWAETAADPVTARRWQWLADYYTSLAERMPANGSAPARDTPAAILQPHRH